MNRTILTRQTLATSLARQARRSINTSSTVKAAAGHDDHHGHGHAAGPEDPNVYTKESFLNPTWRNTLIASTLLLGLITFLPSPSPAPLSPSTSASSSDKDLPWLTKQLKNLTTPASVWTERNQKHLELTVKSAENRLLFQEAERPRVYRLKDPAFFDTLPPHRKPVGASVDLSDLVVKNDAALPELK